MSEKPDTEPRLFTFTMDGRTAQLVKCESIDAGGSHHELSEDEKARLLHEGGGRSLEDVFEQAFEAGIACILGGRQADSDEESPEDAELRHLLLTPLIEGSAAKRLMQREHIHRAILGTLLREKLPSAPHPEPRSSSGQRRNSNRPGGGPR